MVIEHIEQARRQAETKAYVLNAFVDYDISPILTGDIVTLVAMYPNEDFAIRARKDLEIVNASVQIFENDVWNNSGLKKQITDATEGVLHLSCDDLSLIINKLGNNITTSIEDRRMGTNIRLCSVINDQQTTSEQGAHLMSIQSATGIVSAVTELLSRVAELRSIGQL
jgi:hypothetical protein